ncbi:MAG: N-acetyltransferase [Actinomycetota bacterium]
MNVRPERSEDRTASIEVERAAFGQPLEPDIVVAVRDDPGSIALVAEDDGQVVGHVQLSTAWVGDDEVLALGPIGVAPAWQRRGIGTALVAAALGAARDSGARAVVLLGSPAYYGPRGFEPAGRLGLRNPFAGVMEDGFEIPEEDFQIAMLDPTRQLAGDVRWHPAFG